jgi:hypothetical protein
VGQPVRRIDQRQGIHVPDSTARSGSPVEYEIPLDQFPSPAELWQRLSQHKGLSAEQQAVVEQDYYVHGERKSARYYQAVAVNKAVEAVARGQKRLLLVMATGTGKTYTAFQIIWRLRQAGRANRVLFLVDRNVLADQALINDFQPFGASMTKITKRTIDKSYEVYLSLYQAVTDDGLPDLQAYREFSPDFFDLIVVDECHRGSAAADSAWRQVLEYFGSAVQVGLTATPKETREVSNIDYFGEPVYVYSLRQGIADGFLAPYKVIRLDIDQTTAHKRPIHAHPRRHRHHPRPIELEHQPDRPPPRMLTPKLTHQRLDLRSQLMRTRPRPLRPVRQPAQPVAAIAPQPRMHALPQHPTPLSDLGHRHPRLDLQHGSIPLLDNRHIHQRQSRPPATRRPQPPRGRQADHGTCKASPGTRLSSRSRDSTHGWPAPREDLLYEFKGGSLRSPPAPAAGGRKRPSSPAPAYRSVGRRGLVRTSRRASYVAVTGSGCPLRPRTQLVARRPQLAPRAPHRASRGEACPQRPPGVGSEP